MKLNRLFEHQTGIHETAYIIHQFIQKSGTETDKTPENLDEIIEYITLPPAHPDTFHEYSEQYHFKEVLMPQYGMDATVSGSVRSSDPTMHQRR